MRSCTSSEAAIISGKAAGIWFRARGHHFHSMMRVAAGASGFFTFTQSHHVSARTPSAARLTLYATASADRVR